MIINVVAADIWLCTCLVATISPACAWLLQMVRCCSICLSIWGTHVSAQPIPPQRMSPYISRHALGWLVGKVKRQRREMKRQPLPPVRAVPARTAVHAHRQELCGEMRPKSITLLRMLYGTHCWLHPNVVSRRCSYQGMVAFCVNVPCCELFLCLPNCALCMSHAIVVFVLTLELRMTCMLQCQVCASSNRHSTHTHAYTCFSTLDRLASLPIMHPYPHG